MKSIEAYRALQGLGVVPPPNQVNVVQIPGGVKGTRATLDRMKKIVDDSVKDKKVGAFIRALAIKITIHNGAGTKQFKQEAKALFEWVRDEIKWIRDVKGYETLQYPHRTIAFGGGDCDDLSILGSTLAKAIGIRTRFVAIAADADNPSQYSHVYYEVDPLDNGKWIACDPTVKSAKFGWASPVAYKRMELEV